MDLEQAIDYTLLTFRNKSILTKRATWQALNVSDKPEMATHELIGHSLTANLQGKRSLLYFQRVIKPDLPWADDHWAERVSGKALNPPPSEAWWPHAPEGNSAFKQQGLFSHTYPERFWPKDAGNITGIRYPVGDFEDFIKLLERDPCTRQAYFPIFFPEDTGNAQNVRIPCTLGYHILLTNNSADIFYFIRSCDLLRHFRNDLYFAVRFLLEVMDRLRTQTRWASAKPGTIRMHIGSLHLFRNDFPKLFGQQGVRQ